jgi:hypothetical protein
MNKAHYQLYRKKLVRAKIVSFVDQAGRISTSCTECEKKDCKIRNIGCMNGEPRLEILEKITREVK